MALPNKADCIQLMCSIPRQADIPKVLFSVCARQSLGVILPRELFSLGA